MTDSEIAEWLRQQREDRGWSKTELARRLIRAGHAAGDTAVPELSGMLRNINRWEREGGISERHKLHYCRALGIHPSQFSPRQTGELPDAITPASTTPAVSAMSALVIPAQAADHVLGPVGLRLPASTAFAYLGRQEPGLGRLAVGREVLMSAHEGSDHAEEYEQHGIEIGRAHV